VPSSLTAATVTALTHAARTGKIGDGKILVVPLADALRIRTGEHRENAV